MRRQPATVFVSYSHRDKRWLNRLHVHLKPLVRRDDLDVWDDTRIAPGDAWRCEIRAAVERAAVSILLLSADFLASDFVTSEELPVLLRRAMHGGATVIPIVVQPCSLKHHPELAALQTLNRPNQPLSRMSDAEAEEVFVRVTEHLEAALGRVKGEPSPARGSAERLAPDRASDELFEELQLPLTALSVLASLASTAHTGSSLSELMRTLDARSRKTMFAAVDRLLRAGWIEKRRESGRTTYRLATDGRRQLQRLAAAVDGPVRRVVPRS